MKRNKALKVALVHDYLKEFGGAERVLRVLAEMWPEAPIYTAFMADGSKAAQSFADREVREWSGAWLIKYKNLHSPLRWLIPQIWESFDLREFDVVISSASGYVTKGVLTHPGQLHVSYVHTPPRFLYGFDTARVWQKFWPVRWYGQWLIHQLRQYDYWAAQRPDVLVANSNTVKSRIEKFYRRESVVIYPPVEVEKLALALKGVKRENYFLIVARLVGAKGLELALKAQDKLKFKLKIVGEASGREWNDKPEQDGVEWLGWVSDDELARLYGGAKGFLALAREEDFGMTLVEAQACGTPVVAFRGGGYRETVLENKTGVFFDEYSVNSLVKAIEEFEKKKFKAKDCLDHARKFGREMFEKQMMSLVEKEGLRVGLSDFG